MDYRGHPSSKVTFAIDIESRSYHFLRRNRYRVANDFLFY